jgi:hemerythrin
MRRPHMALITWHDTYSVKVRKFDDEHKKLISLINQLHDAMMVGQGGQVIGKVLQSLIDYTSTHFAAEEASMKLHNYPGYEQHKKEHNSLVLQVLDVQKNLKAGKAPLSQEIMLFLKNWLQSHIQGEDKKYGPFFNAKGVV